MNKVFFDYKLDLIEIKKENQLDFTELDIHKLKNMLNGRIYVFFEYDNPKKRNFMLLDTGIIDYLIQFNNVLTYIDKGNSETFTVSRDYYSNSLDYFYSKENDSLKISEVNSALYTIICNYKDFKKNYEKFRKKVLNELVVFYPQLKENNAFKEHFSNFL
ncbi:hypothetical protein [Epilithonimonas mollis]|uniref:Uncharacterized protein n=1 Tax=Epilithonimonas mollis TaxID=216903 RepID=A0A1M6TKA7_9FLAO|nr:hypothetical protein [Epilithonimonas mollis]SHK57492.1 hypothetical protein SAMN05444371_2941 [Epilithonimonas mollis]